MYQPNAKLNNRIEPREEVTRGQDAETLGEAATLPEEEEVEEAVIPEEVLTLEEEEAEEEEETFNNRFPKRFQDQYSLTLWITPELNTTPAFNFPQLYLTNLLTHRRQC